MTTTVVEIPEIYGDFSQPKRYRMFYGGRGGGKSWAIARVLICMAASYKMRILCCREYQNSLSESVYKLIADQIFELGLTDYFTVQKERILGVNGSEFMFKGLARNIMSIKSMEGIDVCWVEEAQTISQESLDILAPTIRGDRDPETNAPGSWRHDRKSEIWFTWNPWEEEAPIELYREGLYTDDAYIARVNWQNNPWFPRVLNEERIRCKKNNPRGYSNIWEGDFKKYGEAFFSIDACLVDERPVAIPERCDTVFAVMDTTLKGGVGNDGTAVMYFCFDRFNRDYPLLVLDWDLVEVEGSLLYDWTPLVDQRLEQLARETGARNGSIGMFIEDKAAGSVIIPQLQRRGMRVQPIDTKVTSLGKDQRALDVSSGVQQGLVKITQEAYDKVTIFRGQSRNHFLSQVFSFRLDDKDAYKRADDLLDCFCYGINIGIADRIGR